MKQSKFLKIFGGIFLSIGLVLGAAGLTSASNTVAFLNDSVEAEGKVINLDRRRSQSRKSRSRSRSSYYPDVEFVSQSGETITFSSDVGSNPPSHSVGEKVSVRYMSDNPRSAKINSFFTLWFGAILFSFMGLVFAGIGGPLLFFTIKKERAVARVKRLGHSVKAEIVSINHDNSFKVNGRSPWVVSCQWHNSSTNKVYTFVSQQYWFDPSQFLEVGQLVNVKYDAVNPKVHWVDLEDILPEAA